MSDMRPQNAPTELQMDKFRAIVQSYGGPAKQCRFAVRIQPMSNTFLGKHAGMLRDLTYLCESTEFPGRGFDPIEARHYGVSFERPYSSAYVRQADFNFICRAQSYERQFFDDWMQFISPIRSFDLEYFSDYACEIQVFQMSDVAKSNSDSSPVPVYQWTLLKAWPLLVNPQSVTWADNSDILRLSVRFSYKYWYRPGLDDTGETGNIVLTG